MQLAARPQTDAFLRDTPLTHTHPPPNPQTTNSYYEIKRVNTSDALIAKDE